MAPSRAFGFSSSSASSRHTNKARPASDDDLSDADASYHRVKKSTSAVVPKSLSVHKSSSANAARSKRPLEDEEIRAVKKSTTRRGDDGSDVEGALSDELLVERRAYDEWVEKKLSKLTSKREQMLEERLDRIRSERDDIQSQYDELRQLRSTAPEEALDEFKKVAEARYRHDKDLINSLKAKVEALEKRAKEGLEGGDRSMSILNRDSVAPEEGGRVEELEKQHRKEMAEAVRVQKRLEEDVRNYKLQLEQEIAHSKALLSAAPASSSSAAPARTTTKQTEASAASTSLAAMEDEKAVRKLYEDLTGLVITGVEPLQPPSSLRRFKAIFAQEDYYSVLMDLEESTSKIASSGKMRDDIVYVPKIEEDRDGELLASTGVPGEWLDALRFERGMLFKWYEKTRKALLTDEARARVRAREERARRE